ncbi:MAG TPA: c-type cytochrome [Acidimicrobiia bacterium]|nr:c-type cytochrome [Acidimicrobiia bacterium]
MDSSVVITIVVIAAVAWLAFLGVSALRSRGPEAVPSNLAPGESDDVMETKRLERTQQAAVLLSAFLAIGLPLYYLGETNRQLGFVDQFDAESVTRGEHLVEEFACYSCHGPDGTGGQAGYVEKRSGATVNWYAPPLNNVFYRYDRDAVRYWITHGRGNSPMPAWGLAGGGPMNEAQVEDVINYLVTQQVPQAVSANNVEVEIDFALEALTAAEASLDASILDQRQIIADLRRSPELAPIAVDLSRRARAILASASEGIDTDGDGLSDTAEEALSQISAEAAAAFSLPGLDALELDPENPATDGTPDADRVAAVIDALTELGADRAPTVMVQLEAIQAALDAGGDDTDGDGIPDAAEALIVSQIDAARAAVLPSEIRVVSLDPTNEASVGGDPDMTTATRVVSGLQSLALNLEVQANNLESLLGPAEQALENLQEAKERRAWEFDFQGIADHAFDGDVATAERVVGVYQSNCARCHTSGYSAGVGFAQEPGSGGFGPALWDGRPAVQFLTEEALVDFLITGAEVNVPYGVNGFGSGRMPGFGTTLSTEDLTNLARWLRAGNLNGMGAN